MSISSGNIFRIRITTKLYNQKVLIEDENKQILYETVTKV